jgi:hypothetical protein
MGILVYNHSLNQDIFCLFVDGFTSEIIPFSRISERD